MGNASCSKQLLITRALPTSVKESVPGKGFPFILAMAFMKSHPSDFLLSGGKGCKNNANSA